MEYRRFLSYLYLYEHHRKMNCIGFVKAEQRAEEIRLTIQIEEERQLDGRKLSICFYKPDAGKEGNYKKYILDEIVLEWKKTEFYKIYPVSALPRDFHLEEQHGILLLSQDHFYYGSVWKGNEIPLKLFEREDQDDSRKNTVGKNTVEVTEPKIDKDEMKEKAPGAESDTAIEAIEAVEAIEIKTKDSDIEPDNPDMESEGKMPEQEENVTGEEESVDSVTEAEKEDDTEKETMETMEAEISSQSMEEDIPVFQEGNRISIQQLRNRNGEKNRYSNNPFLLQAYQKYGHILEAKIRYHGKACECIGAPGIYGNREKYMAEMYHFPIFLCMSDHKTKTGEFGYWIHMIP